MAQDAGDPEEAIAVDQMDPGPLMRLDALLDRQPVSAPKAVPPLGHWLYFLPDSKQSDLGEDGHPRHGSLHVVPGRRMWAGGRVDLHAELPVGQAARRRTTVSQIRQKQGKSGSLTFVTLRHEIEVGAGRAITEEQDLVYREVAGTPAPGEPDRRVAQASRAMEVDETMLFRYSALTFNAHRIHYDRDYATKVEGYPALVVHGPLQATLLVDFLARVHPSVRLRHFAFRGVRPLFERREFTLNLAEDGDGFSLWTRDDQGFACMQARAIVR